MSDENVCTYSGIHNPDERARVDGYAIKIKMLTKVNSDIAFLLKPEDREGWFLEKDTVYSAITNPQGAISGICNNGKALGVKPDEFEFIKAPEWVLRIHAKYQNTKRFKMVSK